jgi:hypothetical protein
MPHSLAQPQVLDRELLGIRAKLIDLAATLDRIDRGEGSLSGDPRMAKIRRSLHVLLDEKAGRAEQVLAIFSLPYEEH